MKRLKKESDITVTKFSVVGYSLGGVIARYMIGKLRAIGFFERISPEIFTTFATPHLGVKMGSKPVGALLNFLGAHLIGISGRDLFLKTNALKQLDEGVYFEALELFKCRYLLANVRHDRTVAFYTAFITDVLPFEHWDRTQLKFLPGIPKIKVANKLVQPKIVDLYNSQYLAEDVATPKPTFQKRLRYVGVILLIGLIIPLWFPLVVILNTIGTLLSSLRLFRFDLKSNNETVIKSWDDLRAFLYDDEDTTLASAPSDTYGLSRTKTNTSVISGEFAGITEGVVEGILEGTKRNYDLDGREESEPDEPAYLEDDKLVSFGGYADAVKVNFTEYEKGVAEYKKLLSVDHQDQYPVFNTKRLEFEPSRTRMKNNLNSLQWVKIAAYVDTFNAHGGIVARSGIKGSARGFATIYFWSTMVRLDLKKLAPE